MTDLIGILPWILIYCIGVTNVLTNTKKSNDIFFFILFLFSALRYNVGFDYMSYDYLISEGSEHAIGRIEYIQQILIYLSREYFHQLFFIVNSFIAVYFVKWALERLSVNLSISAIVFLCFPLMFTNSMNIIRFWSALAIIFYASTFLEEKRYIRFGILLVFALGFHNGAIVALLFIPLYLFRIPLLANYVILIIGFIGGEFVLSKILSGIFPENMYSDQLLLYATKEHQSDGLSKIPYLYLVCNILFLLRIKRLEYYFPNAYRYVTIFNVGVAIMFLMSFQATLATRLSRPFILYFLNIIPMFMSDKQIFKINMSLLTKKLLLSTVCFILLMYLITISNETLGRSQFLPYQVFFL